MTLVDDLVKTKSSTPRKRLSMDELRHTQYDTNLDLYRQRSKALASEAQGLERYVYQIFGSDLIGSVALAINPWDRFEFSGIYVTPANRTRVVKTYDQQIRKSRLNHIVRSTGTVPDLSTLDPTDFLGPNSSTTSTVSFGVKSPFPQLSGTIHDTTFRTRQINSPVGEFELFIPSYHSGDWYLSSYTNSDIRLWFGPGTPEWSQTEDWAAVENIGPNFTTTKASVDALLPLIRAQATTYLASKVYGMVNNCLPSSRKYRMAYQLGELKDTPQQLRDLVAYYRDFQALVGGKAAFQALIQSASSWRDPRVRELFRSFFNRPDLVLKDAANHWLAFQFGWESTYQAVTSFLKKPEQIAKRINLLIAANNSDLTLRSSYRFVEPSSLSPTFSDDYASTGNPLVHDSPLTVSGLRKVKISCAVNSTIKFPKIDPPELRSSLIDRLYGLTPCPSDIYDLIPWTWLIDWFSDLGDYVHLMDNLLVDQFLINYGFLTYASEDTIQISRHESVAWSNSRKYNNVTSGSSGRYANMRSDTFSLKYHLRKDVTSISEYKSPTSGGLSDFQASILGSLLAKFL